MRTSEKIVLAIIALLVAYAVVSMVFFDTIQAGPGS
jgi:hypothetical protein